MFVEDDAQAALDTQEALGAPSLRISQGRVFGSDMP